MLGRAPPSDVPASSAHRSLAGMVLGRKKMFAAGVTPASPNAWPWQSCVEKTFVTLPTAKACGPLSVPVPAPPPLASSELASCALASGGRVVSPSAAPAADNGE